MAAILETAKANENATLPAGLQKMGDTGSPQNIAGRDGSKVIFRAAEKSVEFFDHLRAHYRETRRTACEIPCDIRLVLNDGSTFDTGTGTVRNVSPSGAMLANLKMSTGCFPAKNFKVMLILRSEEYKGITIEALPIRFAHEEGGLGVKFEEIMVEM